MRWFEDKSQIDLIIFEGGPFDGKRFVKKGEDTFYELPPFPVEGKTEARYLWCPTGYVLDSWQELTEDDLLLYDYFYRPWG